MTQVMIDGIAFTFRPCHVEVHRRRRYKRDWDEKDDGHDAPRRERPGGDGQARPAPDPGPDRRDHESQATEAGKTAARPEAICHPAGSRAKAAGGSGPVGRPPATEIALYYVGMGKHPIEQK